MSFSLIHTFGAVPLFTARHLKTGSQSKKPFKNQEDIVAYGCSLVAISGLNGHAFGSFKKSGDSYMWLRDALPQDLPTTKITIFGHDTKLQGSQSFQNISDIGTTFQTALRGFRRHDPRKPLLLLGHSLGGIVIKEVSSLLPPSKYARLTWCL